MRPLVAGLLTFAMPVERLLWGHYLWQPSIVDAANSFNGGERANMSEERNSVQALILQLQIASGGSLFVAGICFYGGFTLTNPNGPALFIPGFAFAFVAWIGWLVTRIVKKQEVRLNRLEEERRIPGIEPVKGDIQGKNAEHIAAADRPRDHG